MSSFVDLCLRIPNLGTIGFFLIFVLLVPLYLYRTNRINEFKWYLPFMIMLAIILTEAGKPDSFNNLYPIPPNNITSFMSVNMINGLAMAGLLLQCISMAMVYNSIPLGIVVGIITFSIAFPMAQQILPFYIREGSYVLRNKIFKKGVKFPGNWDKYVIGFMFVIFLLGIENLLVVSAVSTFTAKPYLGNNIANNFLINNLN